WVGSVPVQLFLKPGMAYAKIPGEATADPEPQILGWIGRWRDGEHAKMPTGNPQHPLVWIGDVAVVQVLEVGLGFRARPTGGALQNFGPLFIGIVIRGVVIQGIEGLGCRFGGRVKLGGGEATAREHQGKKGNNKRMFHAFFGAKEDSARSPAV